MSFNFFQDYLLLTKINFSEIIERFLINEEEQNLQIFVSKIFYFIRRNQNEYIFDFFLYPLIDSSGENDLLILKKLCDWKFYVDELSEVYLKHFKRMIFNYFIIQSPSNLMIETLKSVAGIVEFDSLYMILSELATAKIEKFLSLWTKSEIPKNCFESAIAASFPESDILLFLSDICENITLSEKLQSILVEKSEETEYDVSLWKKIIKSDKFKSNLESEFEHSARVDYEKIILNIESDSPTDIAFGMYSLRQSLDEKSSSEIDLKLLNSVISCLFHDDR